MHALSGPGDFHSRPEGCLEKVCTAKWLTVSLLHLKGLYSANVTAMAKTASIGFLDVGVKRKGYTGRVVEAQRTILEMSWPAQKNHTSIAGGSRALFLGAQTNRGLQNGCVAKRTFDVQYAALLEKARALAKCCVKELPYLGMCINIMTIAIIFCESRVRGAKIANRRFEAIRSFESLERSENGICSGNRFARIAMIRAANRRATKVTIHSENIACANACFGGISF